MAVSLKDVAEKAGVSPSLVSYIVNNKHRDRISRETWYKVKTIAKELNYVTQVNARNLRSRFARNVGICIQKVSYLETPHFMRFLAGVVRALGDLDYDFHICTTADSDTERNTYYLNKVNSGQISGLLIEDDLLPEKDILELHKNNVPIVLINRQVKNKNVPCVLVENEKAVYEATRSLVDHGHKRIFLWQVSYSSPSANEKLLGYMRCLDEAKLLFDPDLIGRNASTVEVGNGNVDYCTSEMQRLLSLTNPPTAMVITSIPFLNCIIHYFNSNNLKIPDDISLSVMDFGDLSDSYYPRISSVFVSAFQMGYQASDLLVKIMTCKEKNRTFEFSEPAICPYTHVDGDSIKTV